MIRGIDTHRAGERADSVPTIPGCEFIRYIGEGETGAVYQARVGRRIVAVKVFWENAFPNVEILERFTKGQFSKGRGGDTVQHPNLQPVLQMGQTTTGELFCCTPFLAGDALAQVLHEFKSGQCATPSLAALALGPQGEICARRTGAAVELFADVAEGLGVAHEAGIAHRRVHAGNLIFSPTGRLILTDFGADSRSSAGVAEDVRALGGILREILSLDRTQPKGDNSRFGGDDSNDRSSLERLPPGLHSCLEKATAKRPDERYRNGTELALDLRRFLNHDQPHAFGGAFERRTPRRVQRQPAAARKAPDVAPKKQPSVEADEPQPAAARVVATTGGRDAPASPTKVVTRETLTSKSVVPAVALYPTRTRAQSFVSHAVAAVLIVTVSCALWMAIASTTRDAKSAQEQQVRRDVQKGRYEAALSTASALQEFDRGDPIGKTLTDFVKRSAVNDALVGAVGALSDKKFANAATTLRTAAQFVDRPDSLESVARRLDAAEALEARDPVVVGLESGLPVEQLVALNRLDAEINAGARKRHEATLAIRALDPERSELFIRGLQVLAQAISSAPILEALGVSQEEPTVVMNEAVFRAFHDALLAIGDSHAESLFCAWTHETRELLDGARPGSQVRLPPNLVVQLDRQKPQARRVSYVDAWIEWTAAREPNELLRAAPSLSANPDRLSGLISAVERCGSREAPAVISHLVRQSPFTAGALGISALGRLQAVDALLALALGDVPIELRLACLQELRSDLYEFAIPELKTLTLTSPHPELRGAAFECLMRSNDPMAISALPAAVHDYHLEDRALEWLLRLEPALCIEECLKLLRNHKGHVRRAAFEQLEQVPGNQLLLPVTRHLLDPNPGIRAAALSLLKRKTDAWTQGLRVGRVDGTGTTLGDATVWALTRRGPWLLALLRPRTSKAFRAIRTFAGAPNDQASRLTTPTTGDAALLPTETKITSDASQEEGALTNERAPEETSARAPTQERAQ